jgi:hypothetical protein
MCLMKMTNYLVSSEDSLTNCLTQMKVLMAVELDPKKAKTKMLSIFKDCHPHIISSLQYVCNAHY